MRFDDEDLNDIFDRTSGKCHLCHKKLCFANYAHLGSRGAWEVDHSRPRAVGGSDRLNNLYAACMNCNRSKGCGTTRSARAANGRSRAPLSVAKRQEAKQGQALLDGGIGAVLGGLLVGPMGAVIGGGLGAKIGYEHDPDGNRRGCHWA